MNPESTMSIMVSIVDGNVKGAEFCQCLASTATIRDLVISSLPAAGYPVTVECDSAVTARQELYVTSPMLLARINGLQEQGCEATIYIKHDGSTAQHGSKRMKMADDGKGKGKGCEKDIHIA